MRFQPALLFYLSLHSSFCIGQAGDYSIGGRSAGIGNASLTLADSYGLINNPAGIAQLTDISLFASYENRYLLEDFQVFGAGAVVPVGGFSTGIGFYRFGGKLYNEQMISLKGAHKVGFMSLGAGLNYVQYNLETLGTTGVLVLDFGGIAKISDQFFVGAHIYNITQTKLVEDTGERVPTVMRLGISYRPMESFMLNLETIKDVNYPAGVKAGIEYSIIPQLALRSGFSTSPFISCFGVGFQPKKFKVDYSFRNDARLGDMHQISVSYALPGKN